MFKIAVIPARMASSRFPGKPMAKIHGIPMIGHVYHRTVMCKSLDKVVVATCDQEIHDYITSLGGLSIMTSDTHERCSDRTAEALLKLEAMADKKADIVVMVQGDEPMIVPEMINLALEPLLNDKMVNVVNLMAPIHNLDNFEDPNEVKVVVAPDGNAIYFSREPIPSRKKGMSQVPMLKQVCVIPFRRDYLLRFNGLQPTPLEKIESVDMLRVIEHGDRVRMVMSRFESISVDTPEDLDEVMRAMAGDPLMASYGAKSVEGYRL